MLQILTNRRTSRRGVTAVEFAMVAPIVFMILFASMEFMRANNLLHSADNAAYEAARRGIVPGATVASVTTAANDVLSAVGTCNAEITVTPTVITDETNEVTVNIAIPMNSNGLVSPFFLKDQVIRSEMTMVRELFSQTNVN